MAWYLCAFLSLAGAARDVLLTRAKEREGEIVHESARVMVVVASAAAAEGAIMKTRWHGADGWFCYKYTCIICFN